LTIPSVPAYYIRVERKTKGTKMTTIKQDIKSAIKSVKITAENQKQLSVKLCQGISLVLRLGDWVVTCKGNPVISETGQMEAYQTKRAAELVVDWYQAKVAEAVLNAV